MKAILVVDMPEKCEECQFYDGDCCYATGVKKWGGLSFRSVDNWKIREEWCPLKPMPKELVYEGYDSPNKQICEAILQSEWGKKAKKTDAICIRAFSIGYNTCLEALQNESTGSD